MVNYNTYNQAKDIQTVSDIIGSWGFFQFNVFIFLSIHSLTLPVYHHGIAFFDIDTQYECMPGNDEDPSLQIESFYDELGFNRMNCSLVSSLCSEFRYIPDIPHKSSLVQFLNLPCEKDWLRYPVSASYQAGCLLAIILYFVLCKRFGRACLIRFTIFVELVANCACSFVSNYYAYLVGRFFLGLGSFGCFLLAFVLLMEIISKQIRSQICILVQLGWTLGNIILCLLMSFAAFDYVELERYLIFVQVLLFLWSFLLKESPRWDLLNGHYKKAEETLTKAGKGFHKLSHHEIKSRLMLLREHLIEQEVNQKFNFPNRNGKTTDYRLVFKALSLVFSWFVSKLIYFTISYYPEIFTRKNGKFLEQNALYQSFVELAAFLITYMLVRFVSKRIYILVFAYFFVIISIFGELLFFNLNYFEDDINNYYFKLTFMLIIKFGLSLIVQFLLLFTGECFNENLHPKIYGYSMGWGCIGAGLAAFLPLFIDQFSLTWTLIILGLLTILNLFVLIWIPEIVATHDSNQNLNSNQKRISELMSEDSFGFSFKIEE